MIRNVQNGDIKTSGKQFAEGAESVGQGVRARLRMFLGESFIDVTQGTPWFQSILGKAPQDIAEINIKRRILTAPRVAGIRLFNFSSDRNQRRLRIGADIVSNTGETATVDMDEGVI